VIDLDALGIGVEVGEEPMPKHRIGHCANVVGQKDVRKDRPTNEAKAARAGRGILIDDFGAGDVARHQVGRELDACEFQMQGLFDNRRFRVTETMRSTIIAAVCVMTLAVVAPSTERAFAQSFHRGGTEFNAVRQVAVPDGNTYSIVVVEFYHHGEIMGSRFRAMTMNDRQGGSSLSLMAVVLAGWGPEFPLQCGTTPLPGERTRMKWWKIPHFLHKTH
jgi:hypothetical protein